MSHNPTAAEVLSEILREHINCPVCQTDWLEGQPHKHESDCIVGRYEAARREAEADAPPPPAPVPDDVRATLDERPAAGDDEISHELWCAALHAYSSGWSGHCDAVKAVVLFVQKQMKARAEAAEAREKRLREAVTFARDTFRAYAALHLAKNTEDGRMRARANENNAEAMQCALDGKRINDNALAQGGNDG